MYTGRPLHYWAADNIAVEQNISSGYRITYSSRSNGVDQIGYTTGGGFLDRYLIIYLKCGSNEVFRFDFPMYTHTSILKGIVDRVAIRLGYKLE